MGSTDDRQLDLTSNPGVITATLLSGVIAVAVAAAEWVGSGRPLGSPAGTVTFLFTDIEGSTRLLQDLGDRYGAVRDEHAAILRRAIRDGGVEVSTEGDSFFAAFASPVGAVRAAVDAQRGLAGHGWPAGFPVRVRMGLHTGEGALGGDNYSGIDVNRAARVAAAAAGGQVIVTDATRMLVERQAPDAGRQAGLPAGAAVLVRGPGGRDRRGRPAARPGPAAHPHRRRRHRQVPPGPPRRRAAAARLPRRRLLRRPVHGHRPRAGPLGPGPGPRRPRGARPPRP
jgi:class 3 adenylate cyclase